VKQYSLSLKNTCKIPLKVSIETRSKTGTSWQMCPVIPVAYLRGAACHASLSAHKNVSDSSQNGLECTKCHIKFQKLSRGNTSRPLTTAAVTLICPENGKDEEGWERKKRGKWMGGKGGERLKRKDFGNPLKKSRIHH